MSKEHTGSASLYADMSEVRKKSRRGVDGKRVQLPSDIATAGGQAKQPHAHFRYHGGPVVQNPQVFALFVGDWASAAHQARATRLDQFLKDLVHGPYMNILSQYGCGTAGAFVGSAFLPNGDHNLSEHDIHRLLQQAINGHVIPEPVNHDTVYMVFLDDLTGVKDKALGVVMCEAQSDNAFGYHNVFKTAAGNPCNYAIIPGLSDACLKMTCGGSPNCSLHGTQKQEQRQTQVASHEFAEMVSNPLGNAWFDDSSGDENGDVCNGLHGTITVGGRTWTVQRMYSKADDVGTGGGTICVLPPAHPIPPLANVARL